MSKYRRINELTEKNISRVRNMVSLYQSSGQGRRTAQDTDVLRGALVMLHASLEDYLRQLLIWKADTFDVETLNKYRIPTGSKTSQPKVSLGELVKYRGKSVDEVLTHAVTYHLENYKTFNNLGDVKSALTQCGIPSEKVEAYNFGTLGAMIERRHNIVHKADRNENQGGQGNHRQKSIGRGRLEWYIKDVEAMKEFVTVTLEPD